MEPVEGTVHVGTDHERSHDSVGAFVAALGRVGEAYGVTAQAFDARYVVSRRHLERALELADRERARGEAIARDRGVEVLLYAAGRRQIDRALELGVGEGETPAVVLVAADTEVDDSDEAAAADAVRDLLSPAETLGDYDEELVREFYGVSEAELTATSASIEALVIERIVLLVVDR
jgi:KEOPS complex subunit Cgi121